MSEREQRQLRILAMVSDRAIHTQEDLATALAQEGWKVSQATVSRDIAELGLVKVNGVYRRPAAPAPRQASADEQWVGEGVLRYAPAGDNILVLHTLPGDAQSVARAIDRLAWTEVVGTVAGDDTIFLAIPDGGSRRRIERTLARLAPAR